MSTQSGHYPLSLDIIVTGQQKAQQTIKQTLSNTSATQTKAVQEIQSQFNQLGTKIDNAKAKLNNFSNAGQTFKNKMSTYFSGFSQLTTGLATTATSAVNLVRNYNDLADTQITIDRTTRRVSLAEEEVSKQQAKLNKLIAEGKEGTPEYNQTLTDLEQGQQQLQIQSDLLVEAQEDQQRAYEDFYLSLAPTVLSTIGTLGTSLSLLNSRTAGAGTAIATSGGKFSKFGSLIRTFQS